MNNKIITLLLIGIVLVSGCTDKTNEASKLDWCRDNIKTLTCDELLDCYDECDENPMISWIMECRDKFKARIWKCYGGIQE